MSTHPTLLSVLSEVHQRLRDLYGGRFVRAVLYGSHARGDARADSDVDILVVLNEMEGPLAEIRRTTPVQMDLFFAHGLDVHFLHMDEARAAREDDPLLWNIAADSVPLDVLLAPQPT